MDKRPTYSTTSSQSVGYVKALNLAAERDRHWQDEARVCSECEQIYWPEDRDPQDHASGCSLATR